MRSRLSLPASFLSFPRLLKARVCELFHNWKIITDKKRHINKETKRTAVNQSIFDVLILASSHYVNQLVGKSAIIRMRNFRRNFFSISDLFPECLPPTLNPSLISVYTNNAFRPSLTPAPWSLIAWSYELILLFLNFSLALSFHNHSDTLPIYRVFIKYCVFFRRF